MRATTLLNNLLLHNLRGLRVTGFCFANGELVLRIGRKFRRLRCPHCGFHKAGMESRRDRRWRHLGIWGLPVYLEGEIRRLRCPKHGVVTEAVPWARHGSDFTRPFEDAVALLAQKTDKTAVSELFGISWVTVSSIAKRIVVEKLDPERFKALRRIGVDEISFRKRHRYLTVVTCHDSRRVIWVAEGKSADVLKGFFQMIGAEACKHIAIVTMDMSGAYQKAVSECLPNAQIAFDHFHIAKLANEALNEVRRELMREAQNDQDKTTVKGMMWPTLHRMANLPDYQLHLLGKLRPDQPLGRAYLLKETLLDTLHLQTNARPALERWLGWASRSRLQPFVKLSVTIKKHIGGVLTLLKERVTNGLAEGMNNKIRLLSHRAYGFHSAAPLIATIYLCCGGITLPHLQLL